MAEKQDRVNEGARSFAGARSWRKGGGVGVGGGGVGGRSRVVGLGAGGSGKLRRSFSGSRLFGRRSGLRQAHRGGGQAAKSETAAQGFQYASPVFHNAYDPARLLKALPSLVSGIVRFKKGGIKALGATFETHFAELRGATILLFDAEYSDWAGAATNPPVQGLFNVLGCEITKKAPGDHLVLRKPRDITTIHMDFQGDTSACKEWERYLTAAAKQHRVTLSDFEILKAIGKGASGKVFLVRDKRTGEMLALKSIDKTTLFKSRSAYRHAIDERLMLELSLNEPFFIQLKYAFQTYRKIYFVTEFCEGGDLFYYLKTHGGTLNEAQARRLSAETILALEYMHTHGIVYRDLKPENVLLDHQGHLKLADFGLCKRLEGGRNGGMTATICGTHTYAAPEMLVVRQYGHSIDLWTLGIFIYHILRGKTPYDATDIDTVVKNMNQKAVRFPRSASPEVINLITSLLERKPENRIGCGVAGISELKLHAFFKDVNWKGVGERQYHEDNLVVSTESKTPGEVPNFDLSEWEDVSFDEDELEGDPCDDNSLWPIQKVGKHDIMDFLMVGYTFDHEYALACMRMAKKPLSSG